MTYEKVNWTSAKALTAKRLNHMETQYDEFKTVFDAHNHDDQYYTKTESDSKYFHSGHMGYGSGADADLLDGQHLSSVLTAGLPTGVIMIWSGTDSSIPNGWAICDGRIVNGIATPDLRDRFVIGAGGALSVGATGGSQTVTPSGTLAAGNHALTINEIPSHAHSYADRYYTGNISRYCVTTTQKTSTTTNQTTSTTGSTGGGQAHSHTGSISFNSVNNEPPYYSLYYIMKVV